MLMATIEPLKRGPHSRILKKTIQLVHEVKLLWIPIRNEIDANGNDSIRIAIRDGIDADGNDKVSKSTFIQVLINILRRVILLLMNLVSRNEYAPMPVERGDQSVAIELFIEQYSR